MTLCFVLQTSTRDSVLNVYVFAQTPQELEGKIIKYISPNRNELILDYFVYEVIKYNENDKTHTAKRLNHNRQQQQPGTRKLHNVMRKIKEKMVWVQRIEKHEYIHPSFHIKCLAASYYERQNMDDKPSKECKQV